jgi:hypothetical protein
MKTPQGLLSSGHVLKTGSNRDREARRRFDQQEKARRELAEERPIQRQPDHRRGEAAMRRASGFGITTSLWQPTSEESRAGPDPGDASSRHAWLKRIKSQAELDRVIVTRYEDVKAFVQDEAKKSGDPNPELIAATAMNALMPRHGLL